LDTRTCNAREKSHNPRCQQTRLEVPRPAVGGAFAGVMSWSFRDCDFCLRRAGYRGCRGLCRGRFAAGKSRSFGSEFAQTIAILTQGRNVCPFWASRMHPRAGAWLFSVCLASALSLTSLGELQPWQPAVVPHSHGSGNPPSNTSDLTVKTLCRSAAHLPKNEPGERVHPTPCTGFGSAGARRDVCRSTATRLGHAWDATWA
jgi:hypothetical protein